MNATILGAVLASALMAQSAAPRAIDVARSSARFSVSHIWVDRVSGTVAVIEGSVTLAPGSMIPERVTATLDATKVATGEPDRDRSLESPDFFDAGKFPRWTFVSTKIVAEGADQFAMDGDLTIHGVTQPERLTVVAKGAPANPTYHATARIDRRAFGMAVTRLDPTIGATADVTLDVALK